MSRRKRSVSDKHENIDVENNTVKFYNIVDEVNEGV